MHLALAITGKLSQQSGGYRYDRTLVEYCRNQGDTVEVISLPERSYPLSVLAGCSNRTTARLERPADVLLVDGICHPALWCRRPETPAAIVGLVHHLRSGDPTDRYRLPAGLFEREYLDVVDATITTSAFLRTQVRSLQSRGRSGSGASGPQLVAPPGGRRETSAASPKQVAERAKLQPLRVVFVGNVLARKDPQTVLEAFANRPATDWQLTIVGSHQGDPDYAAETVALAAELGIDDRVAFTGAVSDSRLQSILASSHVCCVPSQYEAFGMVYLEAMEQGVVPIASSVGGARECIRDGESGFLLRPERPQKIAARLALLDTDRERLAAMGTKALAAADTHPAWESTMKRVRSFLQAQVE